MLRPAMFPSTTASSSSSLPKRFESLNATQRRAPTPPNSSPNPNGHPANPNPASIVIKIKDEKFFLHIEEELHDLRRVHAHGQEDDLRMGLERCMARVGELAGLLSEAYAVITTIAQTQTQPDSTSATGKKSESESDIISQMEAKMRKMQVELDDVQVELDVTRSNLQMIEKNNEMLEDAVKSLSSQHGTNPRDVGSVGWRRNTPSASSSSIHVSTSDLPPGTGPSTGTPLTASPPLSASIPPSESAQAMPPPPPPQQQPPPQQESRFFKFRFNSSSSSFSSAASSRPQTPTPASGPESSPVIPAAGASHYASLSYSSSSAAADDDAYANGDLAVQLTSLRRDFENLKSQLSRDKDELAKSREELGKNKESLEVEVRKRVKEEEGRKALEEELESLSQALFEEANNMVATERKLRAQSETNFRQQQQELREELREAQAQREALKSALRVVEGEMGVLRGAGGTAATTTIPRALDLHTHTNTYDDDDDLPETSESYAVLPQTGSTISPYPSALERGRDTSISRSRSSSRDGIKSLPSSSRPGTPHEEVYNNIAAHGHQHSEAEGESSTGSVDPLESTSKGSSAGAESSTPLAPLLPPPPPAHSSSSLHANPNPTPASVPPSHPSNESSSSLASESSSPAHSTPTESETEAEAESQEVLREQAEDNKTRGLAFGGIPGIEERSPWAD
ncbi:hypothetical protein BT96DRAFT_982508 [Gymnopus androsaceus JB14]|uniref:GDP/GTP exchange factor Sec2 N-terminal domain-containing protein n=1 Tax=Gymnopus androsaceus JB14 TaxID=1447944 RepID=A0A6A4GDT0_9AGAR|nr:hypothetical protein BT96DRAFT_982508 [Gymnopus androsaceus JB14]